MLGWDSGVVDHALRRRVGPSSTQPRLESRGEDVRLERERESGRRRGEAGRREESCSGDSSEVRDLREAQRKTRAKEGTLAR